MALRGFLLLVNKATRTSKAGFCFRSPLRFRQWLNVVFQNTSVLQKIMFKKIKLL